MVAYRNGKFLKIQNDTCFNMPIECPLQASLLQPYPLRMRASYSPTKHKQLVIYLFI